VTKLVYLARPIDLASDRLVWNSVALDLRSALGAGSDPVVTYSPAHPFGFSPSAEPDPRVEQINRAALERSDLVVALLAVETPSIGVPREIEAARQLGIPVAVMTDRPWAVSLSDVERFPLDAVQKVVDWVRDAPKKLSAGSSATSQESSGLPDLIFAVDLPEGKVPTRAHGGDAGYDLYVAERSVIPPGQFYDVPAGVRVILPDGVWARITGRSSTLRKHRLMVSEAVIDTGWRGSLFAGVWNLGEEVRVLEVGDRVAQLIPHHNLAPKMAARQIDLGQFEEWPQHDARGTNGFGSSGV
jgi:dUTP pyrophosphatase